jgi:hypothetical protein
MYKAHGHDFWKIRKIRLNLVPLTTCATEQVLQELAFGPYFSSKVRHDALASKEKMLEIALTEAPIAPFSDT